ncbi:50S ribosomal protein L21 [Candidatus Woesebacteria bacterium]|nr:MAG: 50S ribosomal protein L21 [Candidatus Woesebacteria bacterium]
MKYAIVKIKGQQHKVSEGDEILVDKLGTDKPDVKVLLVVNEKNVKIGKPEVKGVKVKIKILEAEEKGKKLYVQTFKAKSRYRRKIGFRPIYSRLLIEKIS